MIALPELTYLPAEIQDCELLTETATRSKQAWGYSENELKMWENDLKVDRDYIRNNTVEMIYAAEQFIGFFACVKVDDETMEIDHLWLLPEEKRKGFGSLIFEKILQHGKINQFKKAILTAEPHAIGFYEKMGGTIQSVIPSKIKDRNLTIYQYTL